MNKLILLCILFFEGINFLSCKSIDSTSKKEKTDEVKKMTMAKEGLDVQYDILKESYYSGNISAQSIYIARSFEDAISVMEGNGRNDELFSKVDFEKEALIFVFAGTFNTGGYSINVDSVKRIAKNKISVIFSITSPSPDSLVTQAFTHPSIAISIKASKTDIIQARFK